MSTKWNFCRDQSSASTAELQSPSSCHQTQRSGRSPGRRPSANLSSTNRRGSGLVTGPHCCPMLLLQTTATKLHWYTTKVYCFVTEEQCLSGQAPSYLSDDCQPVSDSRPRRLQSSNSLSCVVRRAHNTYGDRCFATAGPRVWNSLPAELQQCSSVRQFKRCLKTFLFGSWDYGALWLFVKQRRIEIVLLTYLLMSKVHRHIRCFRERMPLRMWACLTCASILQLLWKVNKVAHLNNLFLAAAVFFS